jgi:hypothetical protein
MSTPGTRQKEFTFTFLSISLLAMTVLDATPNALGQAATSPVEKKDIFKVIMTVQGLIIILVTLLQ